MRQSTTVRCDVDRTFEAFVRLIGSWWPVDPLSVGGARVRDVTVEPRAGGRVYERWDDGNTVDWGEAQLGQDCAAPGGYRSGAYSNGWLLARDRFADSVEVAS
ncbi:MAG: hypothetical protein ACLGI2_17840 [Acidimicrobiia bacterium]